jgi:hypothetical protein
MGEIVDGMFQDGLPDWYADEGEEAEYGGRVPGMGVTCRNCGAKHLWWLPRARGDYRLMNPNGDFRIYHPACSPGEFEDLSAQSTPQPADVRADSPTTKS